MIITIDGPTASGKSTLAQEIANKLGFYYLNSGYLYRGLAYVLVKHFGYKLDDLKNPKEKDLNSIINHKEFSYVYDKQAPKVLYENENITPYLKTSDIDQYSSIISSIPQVRQLLHKYQTSLADKYNVVAEGRDCGTVVFPKADLKIFLTASVEERARRWQKDMQQKGKNFSLDESIDIISDRDNKDMNRKVSPLKIPDGAIVIDDSSLSKEELVNLVLKNIKIEKVL